MVNFHRLRYRHENLKKGHLLVRGLQFYDLQLTIDYGSLLFKLGNFFIGPDPLETTTVVHQKHI